MLSHVDMAFRSQPLAWLMLFGKGLMKSHNAVNAVNTEDEDVRISYIYHTKDKNRTLLQAAISQDKQSVSNRI